jgi:hypothetical protein
MQVIERSSQSSRRLISAAEAMHALLIRRASQLQGCTEGSTEELSLDRLPTP